MLWVLYLLLFGVTYDVDCVFLRYLHCQNETRFNWNSQRSLKKDTKRMNWSLDTGYIYNQATTKIKRKLNATLVEWCVSLLIYSLLLAITHFHNIHRLSYIIFKLHSNDLNEYFADKQKLQNRIFGECVYHLKSGHSIIII